MGSTSTPFPIASGNCTTSFCHLCSGCSASVTMMMSSTPSSLLCSKPLIPLHSHKTPTKLLNATPHDTIFTRTRSNGKTWTQRTTIEVSSSDNLEVTVASSPLSEDAAVVLQSASDVVRSFYQGINCQDLVSVEGLISENCVYEDLIFPRPFIGRKAIVEFFNQFIDAISTDLQFVIDDISDHDSFAVGVTWHLEWRGKQFPFSKGCSFYRLDVLNGKRQIIYGRDSVEPPFKLGESALVAIRGLTWLFQQFPQLADQL